MSKSNQCRFPVLSDQELRVLRSHLGSRRISRGLHHRVEMIVDGACGIPALESAQRLGCCSKTVRRWRNRFASGLPDLHAFELGPDYEGVSDKALWDRMVEMLTDRPRSGKPVEIGPEAVQQIVALACQKPSDFGHPINNWTHDLLAQVAIERGIVAHLSGRYVGELLKRQPLRPHKNEYWLFPKIACWESFCLQVEFICELIGLVLRTDSGSPPPDFHLISVDEKTGIQALSRLEGRAPKSRKAKKRQEFEYQRNGTTTLMAALDVSQDKIIHHRIHPTRTEADFVIFIQQTVEQLGTEKDIVFLADQLNTHLSEGLVRYVAQQQEDTQELGKKGASGILKSMATRKEYLQNPEHRIRFVYTPKHCSWLNPIENWFSKLQRHVIKNANFSSVEELTQKMEQYITYYNQWLKKKIKWKFKGFSKNKPLANIKWDKT
ncbi:MAG: IS3 family transposase [Cyanothece sp. SIO2G6]|nr:IS3 family transposase [Cyanothece sp. SIO2G6]